jgi:hypothetical protein
VGSIVTRLDELLRYESLLHLLGQRANRLDFADILDSGKIFLARLSKGQIGATNAFLLGSLLVARFHQTAIARQARNPAERPPYFLILDEAAELLTGTVAEILTGARKYGLGLTLAHQHLGQLRPEDGVRGAVLGSCATRVCFRVDGEDARKLADEFAGFGATDLMNLPDRQAIARLGPRDTAFNLETIFVPTPPRTYAEVYPEILARTRARYCTPRAEIRAQLAELRSQIPPRREKVDPFAKLAREKEEEATPTPVVPTASEPVVAAEVAPEPPVALPAVEPATVSESAETGEALTPIGTDDLTDPPLTAGAASAKSEAIKTTIIQQAGGWQFSHKPEVEILGGLTRIDLVLSLLNVRVACQISYTSTKELEVTNLFRILEAGYDPVFLVCDATVRRRAIETLFQSRATAEQRRRVQFLTCRQFLREIRQLGEAELRRSAVAGAAEPLKAAPLPPVTGDDREQIHRENLRRIQERKQQARAKSTLG